MDAYPVYAKFADNEHDVIVNAMWSWNLDCGARYTSPHRLVRRWLWIAG